MILIEKLFSINFLILQFEGLDLFYTYLLKISFLYSKSLFKLIILLNKESLISFILLK